MPRVKNGMVRRTFMLLPTTRLLRTAFVDRSFALPPVDEWSSYGNTVDCELTCKDIPEGGGCTFLDVVTSNASPKVHWFPPKSVSCKLGNFLCKGSGPMVLPEVLWS